MIICEVCDKELIQSGNCQIYTCSTSFQWIEYLNKYLEFKHFSCHLKDNKPTYKKIILFPYTFELFYDDNKTQISKSIIKSEIKNNKETTFSADRLKVLDLNSIVDFPWNNKEFVFSKLKLYSIFS